MVCSRFALALVAGFTVVPLAGGHVGVFDGQAGVPKPHCEDGDPFDVQVHDYGVPSTGFLITLPTEGNTQDCDGDGALIDFDGHIEFAAGGAWLVSETVPACGWPPADHPWYPTVWVVDDVLTPLSLPVVFYVAVDARSPDPPMTPDCGDLESDLGVTCVDVCTVTFPPGLDGTYQVYVNGHQGHIFTFLPPSCMDRRDNDSDLRIDTWYGGSPAPWGPTDPGCEEATDETEWSP